MVIRVKKIQTNSCPVAFPKGSWCLESPLWLLLSTESFQAALPRAGGARCLPCMVTLCRFSPCIDRVPWVLCVASSLAPHVAWSVRVDGKDVVPPAQKIWEPHLHMLGFLPAPGGI